MSDTALLEAVRDEVSDIKEANNLGPGQRVKYEPLAWTRQGDAD